MITLQHDDSYLIFNICPFSFSFIFNYQMPFESNVNIIKYTLEPAATCTIS